MKKEAIKRSLNQFYFYNQEHSLLFNRPLLDLWLLNKFWGRLTNGIAESEVKEFEEAKEKLVEYNKLHQFMSYCNDLCETSTVLMNREETNNSILAVNFYRGSPHNRIERIYPEIESILKSYYEIVDSLKDNPEWLYKVESECGAHIAFLVSSLSDTSRDYLVENSTAFKRFDLDKPKFFR